ncbi:inosine/xanthosine triphosphatase [Natrarchaeobius chitinivorans]|uniref:Probable inosine/xanthosine triphosphatase n=1 Tax=Natrarchaeobius chitinivorans TaxID=1679083 RepID=A0A3N6ML11_NATCH|nr:inosine/xanthosine triphosphatase [Natrarchaeobius chitinivorans]RQG97960.1 inosine/xanthosine triphosphatase [Natrarchaeobius chitinivorans]
MRVAVGTTNPVKLEAVERALQDHTPSVTSVAVDSGVSEQPRSVAETVTGAKNRARRAFDGSDVAYGVGLEGGVARPTDGSDLFLIMWAGVTDGSRLEVGSGPSIRLPDRIAERLETGEELGPVMDDVLGTDGIAEADGAIGVLTDGMTDRTRALAHAVTCAFGPFQTDQYERR